MTALDGVAVHCLALRPAGMHESGDRGHEL
jgi:hypothetical protein